MSCYCCIVRFVTVSWKVIYVTRPWPESLYTQLTYLRQEKMLVCMKVKLYNKIPGLLRQYCEYTVPLPHWLSTVASFTRRKIAKKRNTVRHRTDHHHKTVTAAKCFRNNNRCNSKKEFDGVLYALAWAKRTLWVRPCLSPCLYRLSDHRHNNPRSHFETVTVVCNITAASLFIWLSGRYHGSCYAVMNTFWISCTPKSTSI
jgi:hypothetical protein